MKPLPLADLGAPAKSLFVFGVYLLVLILFGLVDLTGALWTARALRNLERRATI